jgi:AcrR family transcriptional regulator
MLDAARYLILERGSRSATIESIAELSGAPIGSIYHRFSSRDELIAQLWTRAVYRSQASFLVALEVSDPREAALAAGLSILDFCTAEPADARLLVSTTREDLMQAAPSERVARELEELNRPVERAIVDLSRGLFGRATRPAIERTILAVFDLPYGAARRFLIAGSPLPSGLRNDLTRAIRAVVG